MDLKNNHKPVDEFKVNKWMRKIGFIWQPGETADSRYGLWLFDTNQFTQQQAAVFYKATHPKRWWRFWA